ncbi:MAG: peptidylprolyl isomerase [Halieaceae bacterium]|jgi:hypothetical protein|nr:peptidylprolyl isomerase [Halieaceae bacterium]
MKIPAVARSPLVHFFALGALFFAIFVLKNGTSTALRPDAIVLSLEEAEQLAQRFSATWRRPPTAEDLDRLMRAWALEEAHVREALALGLDRNDTVIRQRLNLKMQFLAESAVASLEPDDDVLRAYLAANPERFSQPARTSFEQILLAPGSDPEHLKSSLAAGAAPAALGKPSLLPKDLSLETAPAIDRQFGEGFSAALTDLPVAVWAGPVESTYGRHLVRISEKLPARLPPFAEIRARVEMEWRAEKKREQRMAFGEALLERYAVELPAAAKVLSR